MTKDRFSYWLLALRISLVLLVFSSLSLSTAFAQVKNVYVEKYYVADSSDATDTTAGRSLAAGAATYRVYAELLPGYSILKLYGDVNHPLVISSTADFYNNTDRPAAYFGYLVNKSWFADNPLLALDSWLTIGLAAKTSRGIFKSLDTDGSLLTGNTGGTAAVPGGLLNNADSSAGIPIAIADGLVPYTGLLSQWVDDGFKDQNGIDTTVFGSVVTGKTFRSNTAYLRQNSGFTDSINNKILVAQLTTAGQISFELNIQVEDSNGVVFNCVATGDTLLPGEVISPALKYPQVCGCTDPQYLEYSASNACSNNDSCKTRIRLGCMDSTACNFDPDANFNVPLVCCYPGYCNDRDISIVCPALNTERNAELIFSIFPNPADQVLHVAVNTSGDQDYNYSFFNTTGSELLHGVISIGNQSRQSEINIAGIPPGLYLLRLETASNHASVKFIKH